jgi:hypothetical protein
LVSVVSIDIDGDDAAVFENLGFLPEMAIVEFNPTLGVDSIYRNPPRAITLEIAQENSFE